eukprot:TRINITY_DN3155_c1_g1_i1.p1 TRINITY_DN3155_c1_g1~~TRINITY_DN3155_c1_g1_i1.p1  ORF type:complete len:364 (-),score=53.24 TRINITY_DN3155_c1_g1_i1:350-1441(-)
MWHSNISLFCIFQRSKMGSWQRLLDSSSRRALVTVAAAAFPSAGFLGTKRQYPNVEAEGETYKSPLHRPSKACQCQQHVHDLDKRAAMSSMAKSIEATSARSIACNNGRNFPINQKTTALVIIDMQNDFLSPTGRVGKHYQHTPICSGVGQVERLLQASRAAGLVVAHSRSHRYGAVVRDDLVSTSDHGYQIIDSLKPLPGEIVVDKWTFGAFASTPLEEELRARGVDRIILCGVLTNVCVFATAMQAVDTFFRVCLVEDACGAFNQDWHDTAIRLIGEPQAKAGHNAQVGLYFGEVTQCEKVEQVLQQFSGVATVPVASSAATLPVASSAAATPVKSSHLTSATPESKGQAMSEHTKKVLNL